MVIQCKQNILGTLGELKSVCVLPKPLACSPKASSWNLRSEERLCVRKAHLAQASFSAPNFSSYLLLKIPVKMFSSLSPLLYPSPPSLPSFFSLSAQTPRYSLATEYSLSWQLLTGPQLCSLS